MFAFADKVMMDCGLIARFAGKVTQKNYLAQILESFFPDCVAIWHCHRVYRASKQVQVVCQDGHNVGLNHELQVLRIVPSCTLQAQDSPLLQLWCLPACWV